MTHSLSHNLTKSARNILLLSAASLVLAACGGGTVATPGNSGPVTISPPVSPPPAATVIDLVPVACSTGTTLTTITVGDSEIEACAIDKDANGAIMADLTLDPNIGYALVGPTFVGVDGGVNATLTIPAGTTIFGASDDGDDYLVITRGSKIEANGTAANPIIMTARADILGDVDPINSRGLWGGLVLNGFAPINACDTAVAGGSANCEKNG